MTDHPPVHAPRLTLASTHELAAAAERVFPLLCPVREYDWLEGWACELVHSASGTNEPGCVFVTDRPSDGRQVWVTAVHDAAERRILFVRFGADRVVTMELTVAPVAAGRCRLAIAFVITGLGPAGAAHVEALRAAGGGPYAAVPARLARALEHYLTTGTALRAAPA